MKVNWCEVTITNGEGAVLYRNAYITDWEITAENVSGLVGILSPDQCPVPWSGRRGPRPR